VPRGCGKPRVATFSFTVAGTPSRGSASPSHPSRLEARASARAPIRVRGVEGVEVRLGRLHAGEHAVERLHGRESAGGVGRDQAAAVRSAGSLMRRDPERGSRASRVSGSAHVRPEGPRRRERDHAHAEPLPATEDGSAGVARMVPGPVASQAGGARGRARRAHGPRLARALRLLPSLTFRECQCGRIGAEWHERPTRQVPAMSRPASRERLPPPAIAAAVAASPRPRGPGGARADGSGPGDQGRAARRECASRPPPAEDPPQAPRLSHRAGAVPVAVSPALPTRTTAY
jgi:hypothetical protein